MMLRRALALAAVAAAWTGCKTGTAGESPVATIDDAVDDPTPAPVKLPGATSPHPLGAQGPALKTWTESTRACWQSLGRNEGDSAGDVPVDELVHCICNRVNGKQAFGPTVKSARLEWPLAGTSSGSVVDDEGQPRQIPLGPVFSVEVDAEGKVSRCGQNPHAGM